MINAYVQADVPTQARYQLLRGETPIARGTTNLHAGMNRLSFRDRAFDERTLDYRLVIDPVDADPITQNNIARRLIGVRAAKPVLVVTQTPGGALATALRAQGINTVSSTPQQADWSIAGLTSFSAVILENIAIQDVGLDAAHNLAALVEQQATGLVMTGGRRSFAAGGWYESPLDPILPVSMELRNEIRELAVSIAITMDRSGSMGMTVPGGPQKIELAGLAAAAVLETLTPLDQFAAIAVDSEPHVIVPMGRVSNKSAITNRLRSIRAGGGGIFVFNALRAAAEEITRTNATGGHIILLADAADAVEPGNYIDLLKRLTAAGVTVSVVGLGTASDTYASLLRDIAQRGNGRIFFTQDARLLPQLFMQDAVIVARSAFLEQETQLAQTGSLRAMAGVSFEDLPSAGGYNPTFPKPQASVQVFTLDEYEAPFVASWPVGAGRVAVYTGEIDGDATGQIGQSPQATSLIASIVRWAASAQSDLPDSMMVEQHLDRGNLRIDLNIDPDDFDPTIDPQVLIIRRSQNSEPQRETIGLDFTDIDRLSANVTLGRDETVAVAIRIDEDTVYPLSPATRPYPPEFRVAGPDEGRRLLTSLSRITGGQERADLASTWDDMPSIPRTRELSPVLYSLAILLLLFEVAERRLALSAGVSKRADSRTQVSKRMGSAYSKAPAAGRSSRTPKKPEAGATPQPTPTTSRSSQPGADPTEDGLLGALKAAKRPR